MAVVVGFQVLVVALPAAGHHSNIFTLTSVGAIKYG
jgi:hypothetical protein